MSIDPELEELLPLPLASKQLPQAPSAETLRRYNREGIASKSTGQRCYLEVIQIGRFLYTSREAWKRFIEAQNRG